MKKLLAIGMAAAMMAAAGAALADDSNILTVQASVTGTCKFVSNTATLNFGALDPSVGNDINGSTSVNFWCTKGVTTDAVTSNYGSNAVGTVMRMAGPGGDFIPYTLTLSTSGASADNAGPSAPRTLTIAGNIVGSDYTGVTAGSYSDTVRLDINP